MDFTKWQMKDGTILNISDMTTEHIKNCILFCKNGLEQYEFLKPDAYEELPEPANHFGWFGLYANKYIEVFKEELKTR